MKTATKGNIHEKLASFSDHWNPRVIAELNGQLVKAAKIKGEFVWHSHAEEDEMFLVVKGDLSMEFRDRTEELTEGDFIVIPKGTEHRPVADQEVEILLFEPDTTINTGEVKSELTRKNLSRI
jgi:mannose-6-phosphate isomerase-like protein (cupin superfamily)